MWISRYFIEFLLFSFIGWIWETIYVTICTKKWENRGFLFGPICPIYGVGGIFGAGLVDFLAFMKFPPLEWWQVVIIAFFGSIVLEYSTSVILEKLFHAYWWDYSDMPFNINGRVCLFASCGFALAGLLVVYVLAPAFSLAASFVPPIIMELISILLAAVFSVDMTLTISALTGFDKKVSELEGTLNEHMTEIVDNLMQNSARIQKEALLRVQGFRNPKSENINKILDKIRERIKERKD